MFILTGSGDRQPDPKNLFQNINSAAIVEKGEIKFREKDFEGECHLNLEADASKFNFVNCDVYNRPRGQYINLRLSQIKRFTKTDV